MVTVDQLVEVVENLTYWIEHTSDLSTIPCVHFRWSPNYQEIRIGPFEVWNSEEYMEIDVGEIKENFLEELHSYKVLATKTIRVRRKKK